MTTDIEIAQSATMRPIVDVAADLGLGRESLVLHGDHIAKVRMSAIDRAIQARAARPRRAMEKGRRSPPSAWVRP